MILPAPIMIHAAPRVEEADRGARIDNWTGEPVGEVASGLAVRPLAWTDAEGCPRLSSYVEHEAEYSSARRFTFRDLKRGIVAKIGGRNYRIHVGGWLGPDRPTDIDVTFIPTREPESPWVSWDETEDLASTIQATEERVRYLRDEDLDDLADQAAGHLRQLRSGEIRLRPSADVILFGRPQFLQDPIFPARDGKAAWCLMVIDTGWGDTGNINLLFTVDAEGRPNAVWFEANCC